MKIRVAFLTITLIAAIASMFAYMSFIQTKTYENELFDIINITFKLCGFKLFKDYFFTITAMPKYNNCTKI